MCPQAIADIYIVVFSALHFSLLCHHDHISFVTALKDSPGAAVSFLLGVGSLGPVVFLLWFHLRVSFPTPRSLSSCPTVGTVQRHDSRAGGSNHPLYLLPHWFPGIPHRANCFTRTPHPTAVMGADSNLADARISRVQPPVCAETPRKPIRIRLFPIQYPSRVTGSSSVPKLGQRKWMEPRRQEARQSCSDGSAVEPAGPDRQGHILRQMKGSGMHCVCFGSRYMLICVRSDRSIFST